MILLEGSVELTLSEGGITGIRWGSRNGECKVLPSSGKQAGESKCDEDSCSSIRTVAEGALLGGGDAGTRSFGGPVRW